MVCGKQRQRFGYWVTQVSRNKVWHQRVKWRGKILTIFNFPLSSYIYGAYFLTCPDTVGWSGINGYGGKLHISVCDTKENAATTLCVCVCRGWKWKLKKKIKDKSPFREKYLRSYLEISIITPTLVSSWYLHLRHDTYIYLTP